MRFQTLLSLLFSLIIATEQLSLHTGFKDPFDLTSKRNQKAPEEPCPYHPSPQPLPNPLPSEIASALETAKNFLISSSANIPGFFVNIVYLGQTLFEYGHGAKDLKYPNVPPDSNTIFRIGSVSKTFAAVALFQAIEDGLIYSLDDPIRKYIQDFPSIVFPFGPPNSDITWRQIVSHLSGLPREAPCNFSACFVDSETILSRLSTEYLSVRPYTRVYYSNLAISLIGRLLEGLRGQKFEEIVQTKILNPLKMYDTGFDFTPSVIERMAVPYNIEHIPVTGPPFELGWSRPAGQMFSTGADLAKFVNFLASSGAENDTNPVLNPDLLRQMLLPTYVDPDANMIWSFPWESNLVENYLVRKKSGVIFGFTAVISVIPELQLGCNILWNSVGVDSLSVADGLYKILIPAFEQALLKLQPQPVLPPDVQDYEGIYYSSEPGYETFEIVFQNGLLIFAGAAALNWVPSLGDTFVTYIPPGFNTPSCDDLQFGSYIDSFLTFSRGRDGKIKSFYIPGLYWGVSFSKN